MNLFWLFLKHSCYFIFLKDKNLLRKKSDETSCSLISTLADCQRAQTLLKIFDVEIHFSLTADLNFIIQISMDSFLSLEDTSIEIY